jgi:vacuolar-type H+-ATPase subunit H
MDLKLIYEITIGDIISGISVILFCWFTYQALKQTRKNMERPRIIELLRLIISPTIVNLGEIIRNIEKGIAHYDRAFITIEDTYKDELILSEFKDKYPEILNDIKELDSICKSAKEKYNELHNIIFEEIKDESIKKIKEFNKKFDTKESSGLGKKIYTDLSEEEILKEVKQEFSYYILGAEPSSSSMKNFWNEHRKQLSEARKKGKEIESSIEKDVNKIREMIKRIEPRLTEKRNSLMKEYGIAPGILKGKIRWG